MEVAVSQDHTIAHQPRQLSETPSQNKKKDIKDRVSPVAGKVALRLFSGPICRRSAGTRSRYLLLISVLAKPTRPKLD